MVLAYLNQGLRPLGLHMDDIIGEGFVNFCDYKKFSINFCGIRRFCRKITVKAWVALMGDNAFISRSNGGKNIDRECYV